jgi:hypothetical protein
MGKALKFTAAIVGLSCAALAVTVLFGEKN